MTAKNPKKDSIIIIWHAVYISLQHVSYIFEKKMFKKITNVVLDFQTKENIYV